MTYQQAEDWCVNNVPMSTFDNFEDWYEQCESELATPELTDSDRFKAQMETRWNSIMPSEREQDMIVSEQEEAEDFEEASKEPITYNVPIEREIKLPASGRAPIILAPIKERMQRGAPVRIAEPAPQPPIAYQPAPLPPKPEPAPKQNRISAFFSGLAKRFRR